MMNYVAQLPTCQSTLTNLALTFRSKRHTEKSTKINNFCVFQHKTNDSIEEIYKTCRKQVLLVEITHDRNTFRPETTFDP